eukprot:s2033_g1.t1
MAQVSKRPCPRFTGLEVSECVAVAACFSRAFAARALGKICVPKFQFKGCPAPCTAEALLAGNQTCVLINLDDKGNFKSETIKCIGAKETCGIGDGMKRCPSGASVTQDTTCVNMYAATTQTRRLSTTQSAQRETCNAIITMSSLRSDAKSKAETVRVKMNSVLQVPSSLKTSLAIKTAATTQRRLNVRQLSGTTSTMIFHIDNQGVSSSVTPAQVCEQLKKMVKSSSPSLTSAVSAAGEINAKAGVNMEISTTALKSRAQVAIEKREEKAGITRPPTTTSAATDATTTGSAANTTVPSSRSHRLGGGTW